MADDFSQDELLAEAKRRGLIKTQSENKPKSFLSRVGETALGTAQAVGRGVAGPLLDYPAALASYATTKASLNPTTFKQELSDVRDISREIEQKTPIATPIGKVIGAIGPLSKGTQVVKGAVQALKVAPKLAGVFSSGLLSGLYGAIQSADKPKNIANELLTNAALGFGFGAIGEYGPDIAKTSIKKTGDLAKKTFASLKGINPESVDFYARNRKAVNSALKQTIDDLVPDLSEEMGKQLKGWVEHVNDNLDILIRKNNNLVDATPVLKKAADSLSKLEKITATQDAKNAAAALRQQFDILTNQIPSGGKIPAMDLQVIKKQLQNTAVSAYKNQQIGLDKMFPDAVAEIAQSADGVLDKVHKDVAKLNDSLSKVIKIQQRLGIGDIFKGGVDVKKARNLLASNLPEVKNGLKQIDEMTGSNWSNFSKLYKTVQDLKEQDFLSMFKTGRALLGPIMGATAGSAYGAGGSTLGGLLGLATQSPVGTRSQITAGKTLYDLAIKGAGGLKNIPSIGVPIINELERRGR